MSFGRAVPSGLLGSWGAVSLHTSHALHAVSVYASCRSGEALSSLCELAGSFQVTTKTVEEAVGCSLSYNTAGDIIAKASVICLFVLWGFGFPPSPFPPHPNPCFVCCDPCGPAHQTPIARTVGTTVIVRDLFQVGGTPPVSRSPAAPPLPRASAAPALVLAVHLAG